MWKYERIFFNSYQLNTYSICFQTVLKSWKVRCIWWLKWFFNKHTFNKCLWPIYKIYFNNIWICDFLIISEIFHQMHLKTCKLFDIIISYQLWSFRGHEICQTRHLKNSCEFDCMLCAICIFCFHVDSMTFLYLEIDLYKWSKQDRYYYPYFQMRKQT